MADVSESLQEFFVFQGPSTSSGENEDINVTWTRNNTLILLELYKTLKKDVGTLKCRSFKRMWEAISVKLKEEYNINCTPSQCENRWRVLERNFKKYKDNANKTGRGRKDFEYANEMEDIIGHKKNVIPECLLETNEIVETPVEENTLKENNENIEPKPKKTTKSTFSNRQKIITRRQDILMQLKKDKIELGKKKLEFEKEKFEKLLEIEKEKSKQRKIKNKLLKENISVLREKIEVLKKIDNANVHFLND